jgi:hypothetical protein
MIRLGNERQLLTYVFPVHRPSKYLFPLHPNQLPAPRLPPPARFLGLPCYRDADSGNPGVP